MPQTLTKNRIVLLFFILYILHCLVLTLLYYYYFNAVFYMKILASAKVILLEKRLDDFWLWSLILYACTLIICNWIAYKKKQFFWLLFAFLFAVAVAFTYTEGVEGIFIFKKQNGLWKGGFSLSFFITFFYSFVALIVWFANWLALKGILKNQQKN